MPYVDNGMRDFFLDKAGHFFVLAANNRIGYFVFCRPVSVVPTARWFGEHCSTGVASREARERPPTSFRGTAQRWTRNPAGLGTEGLDSGFALTRAPE